MADFRSEVGKRAREEYCNALIDTGMFARNMAVGIGALPSALLWKIARDNYRQFCNREPSPPPAVPFPGGQCQTKYTISGTAREVFNDDTDRNTVWQDREVWGPLVSFGYDTEPNTDRVRFYCECYGLASLPTPSLVSQRVTMTSAISSPPVSVSFTATVTSIARLDGLPDNCGDGPNAPPRNVIPPPVDVPDFVYNDDSGNTINVPLTFAFGLAYFDADFNLNLPVTVNVKFDFDVPVTVAPKFDVVFNVGTGDFVFKPTLPPGQKPPDPTGPDRPDNVYPDPLPPPNNDPTAPDPPPPPDENELRRVIVGCLVTTTDIDQPNPLTQLGQDVNPDVYIPDLGLVSFLIQVAGTSGGWTEDIRVKNRRQVIPCPWKQGAIDVRGTPRPGVEFTVTPIYGYVDVLVNG